MPVAPCLEQPCPGALSGAPVTALPSAKIPDRESLRGKYVEPVAQDASRHAADLYADGNASSSLFESMQARTPRRRGDGIEQEQT